MTDDAVTMPSNIVCTVQTCQGFADRGTTFPDVHAEITAMHDDATIIGPRLKELRLALGYKTQSAFADDLGLDKSTYNPWEKGNRPLTFEGACLIRKKFKIPLDYLFFGDAIDELPMRVVRNLGKAA